MNSKSYIDEVLIALLVNRRTNVYESKSSAIATIACLVYQYHVLSTLQIA